MAGGGQRLTARAAATTRPGRHGDGAGLYLVVAPSGARKWVYRFSFARKVTEMGLGSAGVVSLAQARSKAREARKMLDAGQNPIEARRRAARIGAGKSSFGAVAEALMAAKESEWRCAKHRAQWRMTLKTYAAPLCSRPVDEIDTAAVLAVLTPLWGEKPETASRLRGRIEAVLDAAKARGLRSGENPAAWRGHLAHLLPKRKMLARGHHAAMAYADIPAFLARLREREALAARALEFCILTAARSGEVLGARWREIDLAARIWTVSAGRTKAAREHRVPLCARALAILEGLARRPADEFIFPGRRRGKPLSPTAMEMVLRRINRNDVTVHGFRSAFRDWAGEETNFPREVAEAALAHLVGDKSEQAYRRGDALEKRRALMAAWACHCETGAGANENSRSARRPPREGIDLFENWIEPRAGLPSTTSQISNYSRLGGARTLGRRVQNVPATANCTRSPLKRMMETAPASISAQRKAAGHRGMRAPVNMENSLTLAEAACGHKSKNALPTLCSGAHGERGPASEWREARFAIRSMSRHLQNSPVTTIFTISSFNRMMAAAMASMSLRRMVAAVRGIRRNTGTSFALAKVARGLSK